MINDGVLKIIKIGLEDIQEKFGIQDSLYEKYVEGEVLQNEQLMSVVASRNEIDDWKVSTPLGGPGTVLNAIVLYSLVRHYALESVLETGVSGGFYSSFILSAVHGPDGTGRANHPCVRSLELSDNMNEVGKLIPEKTKVDWELIVGMDSLKYLKEHGDSSCRAMQLYCHDSLHTMSHMMKELIEFKKCKLNEFFIFIDDQDSDNFWKKCLQMGLFKKPGYDLNYISGNESRLQGHLGGFLKYKKV